MTTSLTSDGPCVECIDRRLGNDGPSAAGAFCIACTLSSRPAPRPCSRRDRRSEGELFRDLRTRPSDGTSQEGKRSRWTRTCWLVSKVCGGEALQLSIVFFDSQLTSFEFPESANLRHKHRVRELYKWCKRTQIRACRGQTAFWIVEESLLK